MNDTGVELLYRTQRPLSFFNWLEGQTTISQDYNVNLKRYQNYIKQWHTFNSSTEEQLEESYSALYVDLLRDISLTYSTEEERRFIGNCDFNSPEELDIILPFFVQKLKTIILYYVKKREDLKKKVKNLPKKGTNESVKDVIKDVIVEEIESENLQVVIGTRFRLPSLDEINTNLNIHINELYDDTDYSNVKSGNEHLDIDPSIFIDFKRAVSNAIRKYPVFLEGLQQTFSLNLSLSGTELNLLKKRDFLDYFLSNNETDLKLQLYKNLNIKFMGCDMYYLSTGSTMTDIISGRLFNTAPLSGNIVLNPLNKRYPTVALLPSLSSIFTAYECGKFFIPSKISGLFYNTFDKTPRVNVEALSPNTLYVFPDPEKVGNAADSSGEEIKEYPIVYEIEVSWNKNKLQDAFVFGDAISSPLYELFYPYESLIQDTYKSSLGVSTPQDDLTFWSGERDTIWTNSDVWPDLDQLESLPIDERLKSLLIDQGQMTKWYVDVFGNEYGLFKKNTSTIAEKRTSKGKIYVKALDGVVYEFNNVLRDVLLKLPAKVIEELRDPVNLFIINQTILIETENYVVIDIINYDTKNRKFKGTLYPGFYKEKSRINSYIEKLIGYTYREDNNALYLCFTTLNDELSSSNYKSVVPYIYKFDIDLLKIYNVYPGQKNITSVYSISSNQFASPEIDIRYIESGHFSHKSSKDIYNLTYLGYNLNGIPFVVNEKFFSTPYVEYFETTNPILFKPFLYVYDTNFALHDIKVETGFTSTYSDYAGSYNRNYFKIHRENIRTVNEKIFSTAVVNTTGNFVFTFDWDRFSSYSLYIGCSSFSINNTNGVISVPEVRAILPAEGVKYKVFDFVQEDKIFEVTSKIYENTNNRRIEFNIVDVFDFDFNNSTQPFTGVFCEDPKTFYSEYEITGFDNVLSVGTIDPAFINYLGSTYLNLDWDSYSVINLYIGCSAFSLIYTEDVLIIPSLKVGMSKDNLWYDMFTFNIDGHELFVKGRVLENSSKEKVEIYIGENLIVNNDGTIQPPFTGVLCDTIYSVFKTINVEKVGDGFGTVTSDPACINCGSQCDFLYPVGGTISLRASAEPESIFSGWLGAECAGAAGDCFFTAIDNATISAVFTKIPRYDVSITVNITGANVASFDGSVFCPGQGTCTYNFLRNTPLTLSASPPPPGYVYRGLIGGACDPGSPICAFFVGGVTSLTALYEPQVSYTSVYNKFLTKIENKENIYTGGDYILGTGDEYEDGFFIKFNVTAIQDSDDIGCKLCSRTDEISPGTIYISLCPSIQIKFWHDFEFPTGLFTAVSAAYDAPWIFAGYQGRACEGVLFNICEYGVRGYQAVSGIFTPPFYTLSLINRQLTGTIYNLGNVETKDDLGFLNCATYNFESLCSALYLSGSLVTVFSVPREGSWVQSLVLSDGTTISAVNMPGVRGLSGGYFINNFTTLSVVSDVETYETLTIHKTFLPEGNLFTSVTIIPGPSATPTYTMEASQDVVTLTYPKGVKVELLLNKSIAGYPLYTIGASGLEYEYRAPDNSGLTLDPDPSFFTQEDTLLSVGAGLNVAGTTGPLLAFKPPFYIENRQSEIRLTESAAVTCIFIPYGYVPDLTPPAPIPTLLINIDGSTLNIPGPEAYIITSSSVVTFTLRPESIDGIYVTNTFTLSNYNECFLTISTSPAFSANKTTVNVGEDVTLSGTNNKFYTFSYFNTGSLILGFSDVRDQSKSRLTRLLSIPSAVLPSINSCINFTPTKTMFDSQTPLLLSRNNSDRPSFSYIRRSGCLRYLIVEKRKGFRFKQIGETVNGLDLSNIVRNNSELLNFMSRDGCYVFQFEFYGWRDFESRIFISSDTSYEVRGIQISL
jgi:hypothetical protein